MAAPRRGIEAVVVDPVQFGSYWLLDPIGDGRLGTVHRALLRRAGEPDTLLAIKRVSPALLRDRRFAERFVDVMAHAAKLRHPAHCAIEDIDLTSDGSLYAAMELVPGRDLSSIIGELNARSEAMPPVLAAHIGSLVADALAAAHGLTVSGTSTPLYHGELAPPDILIGFDGRVRLTGLESSALQAALRAPTPRLTYQAPEIGMGDPCSARSDIYSLGACLYELLTGRAAVSAGSRAGALTRRPESHITKVIPRSLAPIVRRALADQPEGRWENAADLARALRQFVASQSEAGDAAALAAFMQRLFEHAQAEDEERLQQWLARVPAREAASRPPLPAAPASAPPAAAATPATPSQRPSYTQLVRASDRPRRPSPPPIPAAQAAAEPPQSRPPATRPPPPARPVAEVFDDPSEQTPAKGILMTELAAEMTDPQGDELRALASSSSLPPRTSAPGAEAAVAEAPEAGAEAAWVGDAQQGQAWGAAPGNERPAERPRSAAPPHALPAPSVAPVLPSLPIAALPTLPPRTSAMPAPSRPAARRTRPLVPIAAGAAALAFGLLGGLIFFRSTAPQPSALQIDTHPAGAEVIVRGQRLGASPLRLEGLPDGAATLELRKDGYVPVKRPIELMAGQLLRLDIDLTRTEPATDEAPAAAAEAAVDVEQAADEPSAEPEAAQEYAVTPRSSGSSSSRRRAFGAEQAEAPAAEEQAAQEPTLLLTPQPEPEAIAPGGTALPGGTRLPIQRAQRAAAEAPEVAAGPNAQEPNAEAATAAKAEPVPSEARGVNRPAAPIERPEPRFPARAKRRDITEGAVTLEFTIDRNGSVTEPKVLKSEPEGIFDEAALRAVREWKYQPRLEASVPVASRQKVTIRFKE